MTRRPHPLPGSAALAALAAGVLTGCAQITAAGLVESVIGGFLVVLGTRFLLKSDNPRIERVRSWILRRARASSLWLWNELRRDRRRKRRSRRLTADHARSLLTLALCEHCTRQRHGVERQLRWIVDDVYLSQPSPDRAQAVRALGEIDAALDEIVRWFEAEAIVHGVLMDPQLCLRPAPQADEQRLTDYVRFEFGQDWVATRTARFRDDARTHFDEPFEIDRLVAEPREYAKRAADYLDQRVHSLIHALTGEFCRRYATAARARAPRAGAGWRRRAAGAVATTALLAFVVWILSVVSTTSADDTPLGASGSPQDPSVRAAGPVARPDAERSASGSVTAPVERGPANATGELERPAVLAPDVAREGGAGTSTPTRSTAAANSLEGREEVFEGLVESLNGLSPNGLPDRNGDPIDTTAERL